MCIRDSAWPLPGVLKVSNLARLLPAAAFLIAMDGFSLAQVPSTVTANINNAPAWQPNHSYMVGQEASTAGGNGVADTRGYKVVACSGACVSAASGGPSGTGTGIADNQVTWNYLSDIDYPSISLWLQNGIPLVTIPPPWTPATAYNIGDVVETLNTAPIQAYIATNAGTSAASGTGPRGTKTFRDNGIAWQWLATEKFAAAITGYIANGTLTVSGGGSPALGQWLTGPGLAQPTVITGGSGASWTTLPSSQTAGSRASPIAMTSFAGMCGSLAGGGGYIRMRNNYLGIVWNGGEYLDDGLTLNAYPPMPTFGSAVVALTGHTYYPISSACGEDAPLNIKYVGQYTVSLTVAPGEALSDQSAATTPAQYSPANGVAIRCDTATGFSLAGNDCLYVSDFGSLSRVQVKSAFNGLFVAGYANVDQVLVDAAFSCAYMDFLGTISNSIFYCGQTGLTSKYRNLFINDTVFGQTGAVLGIYQQDHANFVGGTVLRNVAVFGFQHGCALLSSLYPAEATFETASPPSDYNATDVARQSGTQFRWTAEESSVGGGPATSMPCPGVHTLFKQPFSTANFLNATSGAYDARLVAGSALRGDGAPAAPLTFSADATTGNNILTLNPQQSCVPAPAPYYPHPSCPFQGIGISGPGIPADTIAVLNGTSIGSTGIVLSNNATATGTAQTFTATYDPLQGADFWGALRGSGYDIGASQAH